MKSKGLEWSDALEFVDTPEEGVEVRALCQLKEGDVVAKMPKEACLTTKTSGARKIIEEAGLDGHLGLAFAIMYERSLDGDSPFAGYLQLLPHQECVPIVWTLDEVNELLCGTELHQVYLVLFSLIIHRGWIIIDHIEPCQYMLSFFDCYFLYFCENCKRMLFVSWLNFCLLDCLSSIVNFFNFRLWILESESH